MSDDNVLSFPPPEERPPVLLRKSQPVKCWHARVEVDEDERRVYCADCGVELDAIAVLVGQAKKIRNAIWRLEKLEKVEAIKKILDEEQDIRLTARAKKQIRIIQKPEDAAPGEYVFAAHLRCRETSKEHDVLVTSPAPRWIGGQDRAIMELLAPKLFVVFGWSLVRGARVEIGGKTNG